MDQSGGGQRKYINLIFEDIPRFFRRLSDYVISSRNRARIVIGTDRKNTVGSGYGDGGSNDAESATIDIVAGYGASNNDPDLQNDKSRLYVSGKTDPDDYFGISKGGAATGEPAIVGISDNVYLKARKKTKIIGPDYSITMIDGDVIVEAQNSIEVKVGSNKVKISAAGIELDAGQGISGKILTDLDIQAGPIPVTGAPGTVLVRLPVTVNQKVIVK